MEENSDRYVLVLEDRSEVKSPTDPGRLSVISGQDEKGKIKTVEPTEEHRAAFLVFKKNDGLLKNFMTNLRRQFNDPTHFGIYRIVADRVGESVESLKDMLAARDVPQNKAALDSIRINPDYPPAQKQSAIDPEKVDWKELESLGVSREKLKAGGNLDRLLNWQKTGLVSLAVPFGDKTVDSDSISIRCDVSRSSISPIWDTRFRLKKRRSSARRTTSVGLSNCHLRKANRSALMCPSTG